MASWSALPTSSTWENHTAPSGPVVTLVGAETPLVRTAMVESPCFWSARLKAGTPPTSWAYQMVLSGPRTSPLGSLGPSMPGPLSRVSGLSLHHVNVPDGSRRPSWSPPLYQIPPSGEF